MAKKKGGGAGRTAKAGGAAAGASAEAPARDLNEGDLVLAKVKGWPAWPARIGKLETQGKNAGKFFVTYFGPGQQIGWCTPTEVCEFDDNQRAAAIQKSLKKSAQPKFIQAVKEICAVQDQRLESGEKDSGDENGELAEDDTPRDIGLDGQEDDLLEKEADLIKDIKEEKFLTQIVTLNQQDESIPFNEVNMEDDAEEDDGEKDWSERPDYNGGSLRVAKDVEGPGVDREASHDELLEEGLDSFAEVQKPDSDTKAGRRRAFGNALKKINQTADKGPVPKTEVMSESESKQTVVTYQYGRKKNRNKISKDEVSTVPNGAGSNSGQDVVEDSATLLAETSEAQKKVKAKVGRPSKASQQSKAGLDSKSAVQAVRNPNAGAFTDKGLGDNAFESTGKSAKDKDGGFKRVNSDNGHNRREPDSKQDMYSPSIKEEKSVEEKREHKVEEKKIVKGLPSEMDRFKKGPNKPRLSKTLEEGKKHQVVSKQREEHVKSGLDALERKIATSSPGPGGSKSKGDVKGETSLKRRRITDGDGEGKEGGISVGREKGDAGISPKLDADEKHLPLSKRPKMLASEDKVSEGKQKHSSISRSGLEGSNIDKGSPRDGKARERGTSLPPKADKDRMRKAALDGEAALPPSKRRNRAFAAMSACEAEAATASAAQAREQPGNGVSSNHAESNVSTAAPPSETPKKEGTPVSGSQAASVGSPFKNASVTPDISESLDGGHKLQKSDPGLDNVSVPERVEMKKHPSIKDSNATDSPGKVSGGEDVNKLQASKADGKLKNTKPKSAIAAQTSGLHGKSDSDGLVTKGLTSPVPPKPTSEVAAEKRKTHLTTSESGKLSTPTSGGQDAFTSLTKSSLEDSTIKNAVALANEKRNALKREGDSSASMKVLIAAAQAKQRARQSSTGGSMSLAYAELDKLTSGMVSSPSPSQRRGSSRLTSPIQHGQGIVLTPLDVHKRPDFDSSRHAGWNTSGDERAGVVAKEPAVDTEATIARDTFVGMLETVSRTKDSIGRTTRQAMDCAKHGIAEEIVEVIVRKLENEPSFHRRVDFWFLLDSVTQVAHTQKVAAYLPIVQAFLPRILNAAAPPGGVARENRKQCLKVLNLWLERKVMPESVLRHFMTEIESHNDDKGLPGNGPRRLSRSERAVDDPVRDMDGMLVDEYGSNASLNLPDGFSIIPQLYEDEDEGSEDGEKASETEPLSTINTTRSSEGEEPVERHRHVLEDVDGELEMEDVSPTAESEIVANKEREQLLADRLAENTMTNTSQPPLPLDPPPSVPSPPPLPADPPPSPPPPPRSPPPPLSASQQPYPSTATHVGQSSTYGQETNSLQQSDSPSTPTTYPGFSSHQGQGSSGFSQVPSRSTSFSAGPVSQLTVPVGSPLPPQPGQNSSPRFAQGAFSGLRLPPPPLLPPTYRAQRVWPETFTPPAGESEISPRLSRPGEDQVRQGHQEVSGSDRAGDLTNGQQDAGSSQSGGGTAAGPSEGVQSGEQSSAAGMSGYSVNAPVFLSQDQVYRMNASVRPGAGGHFPYGPLGMQPAMRGRPVGGPFGPYAQYAGPPMPPGTQAPMQMLPFRPGGPTHNSWRPS